MKKDKVKKKKIPESSSVNLSKINVNKWSLFHRWWDKVSNNEIPRPACPNDEDHLMVPGINKDDDPMLRCLTCKTTMTLGSETLNGKNS